MRLCRSSIAAVVVIQLSLSPALAGVVLYVDDDAAPAGDGLSWNTAYSFLQDALAHATADNSINEIRVAQGSYKPDQDEGGNVTPGDVDASFATLAGVTLGGGYAGPGSPDPDVRDTDLYETILTGDLLGDDGPDFTNYSDNARHVVTAAAGAILDGITIAGGNAAGASPHDKGGGIWSFNVPADIVLTNCTLRDNSALDSGGGASVRGTGGQVSLSGCRIEHNAAQFSAGIRIFSSGSVVTVTIDDSMFTGNLAVGDAGGLLLSATAATVTNCTFVDNVIGATGVFARGGGMFVDTGTVTVRDSDFIGNFSDTWGGGIYDRYCDLTMIGCSFVQNTSRRGGGLAAANLFGAAYIASCTFEENTALEFGGGATMYGATVVNCVFVGNDAPEGGGIHHSGTSGDHVLLANSTFYANSSSDGPSIWVNDNVPTVTITNCIVWENPAAAGVSSIGGPGLPTVLHSNIEGGFPGVGNISVDPLFADPANGDLHLLAGSPAIDAGHNWVVTKDLADLDEDGDTGELTPLDRDGNARFADDAGTLDTGCFPPAVVDMGAYESPGKPISNPVVFADLNGDGGVGIIDFLALLATWGPCPETCCLADLDLDGSVGISDFLMLLSEWDS